MATTKRRRRHAREKSALTKAQEIDLLLGGNFGPTPAFKSEQERREAWLRNRDEFMARHPFSHGEICYEHGGFLPEDRGRTRFAIERIERTKKEK